MGGPPRSDHPLAANPVSPHYHRIPINPDGSFSITGWVSDPHDLVAETMRVVLVKKTFSFLWPAYQVEGIPYPAQHFNPQTVVATATANRGTGEMVYSPAPAGGRGLSLAAGARRAADRVAGAPAVVAAVAGAKRAAGYAGSAARSTEATGTSAAAVLSALGSGLALASLIVAGIIVRRRMVAGLASGQVLPIESPKARR